MIPSPPVPDQPGPPPQNIGLRSFLKRCLLCKLAPMIGTRATGIATVKASAGALAIKANSYAIPILISTTGSTQSEADHSRLVKVTADVVIDPDSDPDGTPVPIFAMAGGAHYNGGTTPPGLAAGTLLQWDPPLAGIEARSILSSAMAGGIDLAGPGFLRRLVLFDRLGLGNMSLKGGPMLSAEAWRAKIGDFPAGVLILMGTRKSESGGRSRPIHRFMWRLLAITSAVGPAIERVADGDAILDRAAGFLENTGEVDNEAFSIPRLELGQSNLLVADDNMSIHHLDFESYSTLDRTESRTFPAWSETEISLVSDPSEEYPDRDDALTGAGPINSSNGGHS